MKCSRSPLRAPLHEDRHVFNFFNRSNPIQHELHGIPDIEETGVSTNVYRRVHENPLRPERPGRASR